MTHRELRRAERTKVEIGCKLVGGGIWTEPLQFGVRDISPYGMWVNADYLLDSGDKVLVSFRLPKGGRPLVVSAEVVRTDDRPGASGMALSFVDLHPRTLERLTAVLVAGEPPRVAFRAGRPAIDRTERARRLRSRPLLRALPGPRSGAS